MVGRPFSHFVELDRGRPCGDCELAVVLMPCHLRDWRGVGRREKQTIGSLGLRLGTEIGIGSKMRGDVIIMGSHRCNLNCIITLPVFRVMD